MEFLLMLFAPLPVNDLAGFLATLIFGTAAITLGAILTRP